MIARIVLYIDYDFDVYRKGGCFTRINSINEKSNEMIMNTVLEELYDDEDYILHREAAIEAAKDRSVLDVADEEPITEQWDRDENWAESPEMGAE